MSGEEFANVLGLNSNHFYIEDYEVGKNYLYGVGHGPKSIWVHAMAEEGYSYEDILTHYYTGVNLINLDK